MYIESNSHINHEFSWILKAGGLQEIATLPDGSKRSFEDLMSHQVNQFKVIINQRKLSFEETIDYIF